MELIEVMRTRRSIRTYTEAAISKEDLEKVLQAGLLSASSRTIRPWEFIVIRDKAMLTELSECRIGAAKMLSGSDCAIVVIADPEKSDVWVEDSSIALANMHLMAHSLGIGSCWIQGRLRETKETTTENYLRERLGFPAGYQLEAILSLGMPAQASEPYRLSELPTEKIHWEQY